MFNVFAVMAQFERDLIRERTNAGLSAARARGRRGGRPAKLSEDERRAVVDLYRAGSLTVAQIAGQYHVSRGTVYAVVRGS